MALEDYIRDQEARLKTQQAERETSAQMKVEPKSSRDPAQTGHMHDGI